MKAPRGHTYEKCPGCQTSPNDYYRKGEVCGECLIKLRLARRIEQMGGSNKVGRRIPEQSHWLPYLYHGRELQDYFLNLMVACGTPCNFEDTNKSLLAGQDDCSGYFLYEEKVERCLVELFLKTNDVLKRVYAEGKEHGANLLMQLAEGEITANDFNERTIG
jgi:hypothetical protein